MIPNSLSFPIQVTILVLFTILPVSAWSWRFFSSSPETGTEHEIPTHTTQDNTRIHYKDSNKLGFPHNSEDLNPQSKFENPDSNADTVYGLPSSLQQLPKWAENSLYIMKNSVELLGKDRLDLSSSNFDKCMIDAVIDTLGTTWDSTSTKTCRDLSRSDPILTKLALKLTNCQLQKANIATFETDCSEYEMSTCLEPVAKDARAWISYNEFYSYAIALCFHSTNVQFQRNTEKLVNELYLASDHSLNNEKILIDRQESLSIAQDLIFKSLELHSNDILSQSKDTLIFLQGLENTANQLESLLTSANKTQQTLITDVLELIDLVSTWKAEWIKFSQWFKTNWDHYISWLYKAGSNSDFHHENSNNHQKKNFKLHNRFIDHETPLDVFLNLFDFGRLFMQKVKSENKEAEPSTIRTLFPQVYASESLMNPMSLNTLHRIDNSSFSNLPDSTLHLTTFSNRTNSLTEYPLYLQTVSYLETSLGSASKYSENSNVHPLTMFEYYSSLAQNSKWGFSWWIYLVLTGFGNIIYWLLRLLIFDIPALIFVTFGFFSIRGLFWFSKNTEYHSQALRILFFFCILDSLALHFLNYYLVARFTSQLNNYFILNSISYIDSWDIEDKLVQWLPFVTRTRTALRILWYLINFLSFLSHLFFPHSNFSLFSWARFINISLNQWLLGLWRFLFTTPYTSDRVFENPISISPSKTKAKAKITQNKNKTPKTTNNHNPPNPIQRFVRQNQYLKKDSLVLAHHSFHNTNLYRNRLRSSHPYKRIKNNSRAERAGSCPI